MPAIRAAQRRADAETSFGKIQSVARPASDAIVFNPANMRLIHAALIDQILHEPADWIISQRCHDRSVHPKATLQTPGDIVFAAAFPNLEIARRRYSTITRIKPQHHLAETHQVPARIFLWFYLENGAHPVFRRLPLRRSRVQGAARAGE